ncbi:hypothetical protein [Streptomyces zagrosensis]|uniref:Uncharacterized protein n=1 Tax=Streptomyces zagrosensis TaxID=1042984 RepID=A0A7W9UZW4_9ACTN|nr:hypothetical protein [Streptomyces zagrosensis]MBB5937485.1 hypothetical protein [Streptomyces zagrosensis]
MTVRVGRAGMMTGVGGLVVLCVAMIGARAIGVRVSAGRAPVVKVIVVVVLVAGLSGVMTVRRSVAMTVVTIGRVDPGPMTGTVAPAAMTRTADRVATPTAAAPAATATTVRDR